MCLKTSFSYSRVKKSWKWISEVVHERNTSAYWDVEGGGQHNSEKLKSTQSYLWQMNEGEVQKETVERLC